MMTLPEAEKHGLIKPVPPTPYTITALFSRLARLSVGYPEAGLGWYSSASGKIQSLGWNSDPSAVSNFYVGLWSDYATWAGAAGDIQSYFVAPYVWMRLVDDGTTVYFQYGFDGVNFRTHYSIAKADGYLGSSGYDRLYFWVAGNGYPIWGTMMSYAEA